MKITFSFFIAVACCFFSGCKEEKKSVPAAAPANASGNPLTAPADYLGALGQAQKSAQKTLAGVGLDQAIKVFQSEQGRLPKDLNELVSKGTISQIPPPPRGMNNDYDAKTGVIKVVPE